MNEEQDKIVELFKLMNKHHTKQDAIKAMIEFFDAEIKPKKIKKNEYFK
ncbi:MAG: hypothetical protein ACMXYG_03185 [Candidatus Woesearchaeota archaeon]